MNKGFQTQIKLAIPITYKEYEELEDTSFHINDDPVILNLRYKFYYSGRKKQVGDIVLVAVLVTFLKKETGKQKIDLKTITLHPDEIEDYELFKIQPTGKDILFPAIILRGEKENQGSNSIFSEEVENINKNRDN